MMLLDLFLTFSKIGLFTFGGGYAMIALIEDICVEKKQWITHDEMMNSKFFPSGLRPTGCILKISFPDKWFT